MIRHRRFPWPRLRRAITLLGLVVVLGLAAWPRSVLAACGAFEPMACFDGAMYNNLIIPFMEWLWWGAQGWLLLARIIEGVRTWLVTEVLSLAFDAVIAGIQFPFWIAAMLATIVFAVAFALQGIVEGLHWVQVKRAVKYLALAVFLFNIGSPAVAASEHLRLVVGQGIASIAGTSASQASVTFYAADDSSMDAPHTIYGGEVDCPGMSVAREVAGMYLNDYTANYLWADAADIHCPTAADGQPQLPRMFAERYVPAEGQPIEEQGAAARKRLMRLAWAGIARLAMGNLLAFGATIEQTMQLIYALGLQAIWLGIYLSLLFVLFVPMEGIFQQQITSLKHLYFASWRGAFYMALAMSLLYQAAQQGNGLVVAGIGLILIGLALWQTWVAGKAGTAAIDSFGQTLGFAPQAISGAAKGIGGGLVGGAVTAAALASGFGLPAAVGLGNAAKRSPGNAAFKWAMLHQRTGRKAERQAEAEERRDAATDRSERQEARADHRQDLDAARNQREQEAHDWQRQDRARSGAWYEEAGGSQPGAAGQARASAAGSAAPATEPPPSPEAQADIDSIVALLRTPTGESSGSGATAGSATGGTETPPASGDGAPPARPKRSEVQSAAPTGDGESAPQEPARGAPAPAPHTQPGDAAQPGADRAGQPREQAQTPATGSDPAATPAGAHDRATERALRPDAADHAAGPDDAGAREQATDRALPPDAADQVTGPDDADAAHGGSRGSRATPPAAGAAAPHRQSPAGAAAPSPAAVPPSTQTAPTARRRPHTILALAGQTRDDRPAAVGVKPRVRPHPGRPLLGSTRTAGPLPQRGPSAGGSLPAAATTTPTTQSSPPPVAASDPRGAPSPVPHAAREAPAPARVVPHAAGGAPAPVRAVPGMTHPVPVAPGGTGATVPAPVAPRPAVTPPPAPRPVQPGVTARRTAAPATGGSTPGTAARDQIRAQLGATPQPAIDPAPAERVPQRPATRDRVRPWAERTRQRPTRRAASQRPDEGTKNS